MGFHDSNASAAPHGSRRFREHIRFCTVLSLACALNLMPAGAQESDEPVSDDSLWVTSIAPLDGNGKFVASTANGLLLREAEVVRFDAEKPAQLETLYTHPAAVWEVVTLNEGKTVASVDYQGNLVIYDVDAEQSTMHEEAFGRWCQALIASPEGDAVVAGNEAGELYVWDLSANEASKTVELDAHAVTDLAFSPNGEQVAVTDGGGHVHLLKWPSLESIGQIQVGEQTAWCVDYIDGGQSLLVGSADRNLYRCAAEPDAEPESVVDGTDWITQLALTDSGDYAAGEIGGTIRFGGSDALAAESGVWALCWNGPSKLLVGTRKDGILIAGRSWTWSTPESTGDADSAETEDVASDD